jgi:glycine/D-amino acid oxidase-like deaminating enzyme
MPPVPSAPLVRDAEADVVVVGAGVTGALVAEAVSGHCSVVVLDRRGPVRGSTSASTALVCYEIDTPLIQLAAMIGQERADRAWRRVHRAVVALAARTRELAIDCGFAPRDGLYLAGSVLDGDGLAEEAAARHRTGLAAELLSGRRLIERFGIDREAALITRDDFIVDPRQFAAGYLNAAVARGARVFSPVDATGVTGGNGRLTVTTKAGPTITAEHVIYCTGYELPDVVAGRGHRRLSTYAIATRPQNARPPALSCMISESSDPYLYLRDGPDGRIICGGEDEDFADAAARDALLPAKAEAIRRKLAALLPGVDARPEFAWAGTFGDSETGLPSIGSVPRHQNCVVVLGFGGNGMVYARIAAEIVAARLAGRADPDSDLYATL